MERTKNQQRRLDEKAYRDKIQVTIPKMTRQLRRADEREAKKAETRKIGQVTSANRKETRLREQQALKDRRAEIRKLGLDQARAERKRIASETKLAKNKS